MYKQAACIVLCGFIPSAFGAEAILSGEGEVLAAPDYVEMTITVESKCYPTPEDASKQNDATARKIVDYLNKKVPNKTVYNTVFSKGGVTSSYQNYQKNKVSCQNTFQKQNHITFRTQDIKNFENIFNEIQNTVFKEFNQDYPNTIETPISYVTLSQPQPNITKEQRKKLEQNAIASAFLNAKAKLESLFGHNALRNLKVVEVSEFPPDDIKPYSQARRPMMMKAEAGALGGNAPVQFGDQTIHQTLYFKFQFEDIPL